METDEDTFVVIISEDDQCKSAKNSVVKNEDRFDLWDRKLALQQIIESAQKYGKVVNVAPKDKKIKLKLKEDTECEYLEEYKDIIEDRNKQCTMPKLRRRKMLTPSERKSFIAELKCKYPELNCDEDALLEKIVEAMANIKKPYLPINCCRPKDNKFECQKCKKLFITRSIARHHFQNRHGPRYLNCFACGADFRETRNLYNHEKYCLAPDSVFVAKARTMFMGKRTKAHQKDYVCIDLDLDDD